MADTTMLLIVDSTRLGGSFQCHRFTEYEVDLDLETDADAFDFVFRNPDNVYTSLFSKFDVIQIKINGEPIMSGRVDSVTYHWGSDGSYVRVNGRDFGSVFIDNHALPATLQNVKPAQYIADKCNYYGIPMTKIDQSMDVVKKLIIGVGESEMSIISKMAQDNNMKQWLDDLCYNVGYWDTDADPTYTFTRGMPIDKVCIPILTFDMQEDALDTYSEMIIYGSASSGENKIVGSTKNEYLAGVINKRYIGSSADNDSTSKYVARTEDSVRYGFDNSIKLEISIATKFIIRPNTTARVIDMATRTNAVFFIKKVTYTKNQSDGSITKITMVPGKKANDIMYNAQGTLNGGMTGKASMTLDDLLAAGKG